MTAVLGGGLSGLSAAYYALENPKLGPIVLFEATNRLGGWVCSKKSPNGAIFEQGPRTIRPRGESGCNTLKLIDDLGLCDNIHPISVNDPVSINRYIYTGQKLCPLPITLKPIFKTCPPFKAPLLKTIIQELRTPSIPLEDESLYSFIERRVGKDIADYFISPLLCGICAGDAKQISVNFLMPSVFKAEQKYGSIVKGILLEKIFPPTSRKLVDLKTLGNNNMSSMSSVERAVKSNWAVWTLKGGLEQIPQALANNLYSRDLHIRLETECKELTFKPDCVEVRTTGGSDSRLYERVVSSIPAKHLASLVAKQHPDLANELNAIPSVTVAVINLEFSGQVLPMNAFGFLVPPKEELPILGVIFDSCVIKQENTVLTVMMGGAWFEKYFGKNPTEEYLLSVALKHVKEILNIKEATIAHNVSILRDCIPQYLVGHNQRINRVHKYINEHKLPIVLCGASYDGIGINDVILSARKAVFGS